MRLGHEVRLQALLLMLLDRELWSQIDQVFVAFVDDEDDGFAKMLIAAAAEEVEVD